MNPRLKSGILEPHCTQASIKYLKTRELDKSILSTKPKRPLSGAKENKVQYRKSLAPRLGIGRLASQKVSAGPSEQSLR